MVGDHMGIPRTVVLFCFYASSGCTLLPQGDSTDVFPQGEPMQYCAFSRNLQTPEIVIAILEVMDEDPALSW
jgi:hypothetical protein